MWLCRLQLVSTLLQYHRLIKKNLFHFLEKWQNMTVTDGTRKMWQTGRIENVHNLPKMDFYCIKLNFAANHDLEPHLTFEGRASIRIKTDFVIWMMFCDCLSPTCVNLCGRSELWQTGQESSFDNYPHKIHFQQPRGRYDPCHIQRWQSPNFIQI